jgi:hypothetical protein
MFEDTSDKIVFHNHHVIEKMMALPAPVKDVVPCSPAPALPLARSRPPPAAFARQH